MDLRDNIDNSRNITNGIYNNKTKPLTKENNLLLAKKYMVESIYRAANIEGIGMTFPETQTICDGMSIAGKSIDDINAITDLKRAWQWVFENSDAKIDLDSLKTINRLIGKYTVINAGLLRDCYDEPIRVPLRNGKNYYPPLPNEQNIKDLINNIIKEYNGIEVALELFCQIAKAQIFNNGNKRTANIYTNLYMIQNGQGILSIPETEKLEFYNLLTDYYENDNNKENLKKFLYEKCITGNGRC